MSEKFLLTTQNLKWIPDTPPSTYANVIGVAMTPFDISILFGEIGNATETEVQAIPRIKVAISPEQIPGLIKALSDTLKIFVETNGALRSPIAPEITPK